jgi:hypothetical protein
VFPPLSLKNRKTSESLSGLEKMLCRPVLSHAQNTLQLFARFFNRTYSAVIPSLNGLPPTASTHCTFRHSFPYPIKRAPLSYHTVMQIARTFFKKFVKKAKTF